MPAVLEQKRVMRRRLEGTLTARVSDAEERMFRSLSRELGQTASEMLRSLACSFIVAPKNTGDIRREQRTRDLVEELNYLWRDIA